MASTTLAGGERASVRVTVSDGFHSVSADSAPFEVADHGPIATLLAPVNGERRPAGRDVDLEGQAVDPEDGVLGGDTLRWSSSRDGSLGTGPRLSLRDLSVGTHRISLLATDDQGHADRASVRLVVSESDLPGRQVRRAVHAVLGAALDKGDDDADTTIWPSAAGAASVLLAVAAGVFLWRRRAGT